ncbi:hypothetical protein K503DRAFT_615512 [Rhizopogon vinicolor AM-OR11-026]|uniref:Uncharacterized protein n=1 Tax=Rhizopogon vinicolor AM-OR11-026 TaxID=1314800 RepID=A0A1B7MIE7_9AGAM|nr:hypothetical protein K503DRAFT_615512 [Rhizopogon vinicolor AM-OR11-026]
MVSNITICPSTLSRKRARLTDVFIRGDRYSLCAAMTIDFASLRVELPTDSDHHQPEWCTTALHPQRSLPHHLPLRARALENQEIIVVCLSRRQLQFSAV